MITAKPSGFFPLLRTIGLIALVVTLISCTGRDTKSATGKIVVVATLYPLYDIARAIGGDKAGVTLLIPPGTEPHNFEPRPGDIARLRGSSLFLYTNRQMEPWAENLARSVNDGRTVVIDASRGIALDEPSAAAHDHRGTDHRDADPHVWLDLGRLPVMADNITAGFVSADPANTASYRSNADAYKKKIADLDARFSKTLAACRTRVIVSGGHSTFGYLAARYGLGYRSAYGISPDAEPSPADLAGLVKLIRTEHLDYIFTEELVSARVSNTLAQETGVKLLTLQSGHTVSKEMIEKGTEFITLMESNLASLKTGLHCGR